MQESDQEYDEAFITLLEGVWGEGYLSPGGGAEIDELLQGVSIAGTRVLDIGCGTGGPDVHLMREHNAGSVTGIDVEALLIKRCRRLAEKHGLGARLQFDWVDPGPLPYDDASFDVVFSKDAIIHISDKAALARELYRVLAPGGRFVASDWLAGYEGEPSPQMQAYLDAEGLDFGLASAARYRAALLGAGLTDVSVRDRNAWYRRTAREERARLAGPLYQPLSKTLGAGYVDAQIRTWDTMIVALDRGDLRPSHLFARKI